MERKINSKGVSTLFSSLGFTLCQQTDFVDKSHEIHKLELQNLFLETASYLTLLTSISRALQPLFLVPLSPLISQASLPPA